MTQAKTFVTDFVLRLGMVHIPGSLTSTVLDKSDSATSLKLVCPSCAAGAKAVAGTQTYICKDNPKHQFTNGDARRAKQVGKGQNANLVLLTPEDVAALKGVDPSMIGVLDLTAYPSEQISPYLIHDGDAWVFTPNKMAERGFAVLRKLLTKDRVFCGVTCLKTNGSEKWMYLRLAEDGNIVLQSLVWPEQIAEPPKAPEDAPVSPKELKLAQALIESVMEDAGGFDPTTVRETAKVRHEALLNNLTTLGIAASVTPSATEADTLMEALEASLKGNGKRKATSKAK